MTDFNLLEDTEIAQLMLDDENAEIELCDVEYYCRIFGGVSSNIEFNEMYDLYMQENNTSITKENDNEYGGEYYANYKDMLYNDGTIHELQNDQYEY